MLVVAFPHEFLGKSVPQCRTAGLNPLPCSGLCCITVRHWSGKRFQPISGTSSWGIFSDMLVANPSPTSWLCLWSPLHFLSKNWCTSVHVVKIQVGFLIWKPLGKCRAPNRHWCKTTYFPRTNCKHCWAHELAPNGCSRCMLQPTEWAWIRMSHTILKNLSATL